MSKTPTHYILHAHRHGRYSENLFLLNSMIYEKCPAKKDLMSK
jgi:hypothetical protein